MQNLGQNTKFNKVFIGDFRWHKKKHENTLRRGVDDGGILHRR